VQHRRRIPGHPARDRVPGSGYAAGVNPLTTEQIILLLAPVVIIQLGLMIVALFDLERDERRVRGGSKVVWALIIVFVNIIGPIVYFAVGREDT
jgi:hypothetical protein